MSISLRFFPFLLLFISLNAFGISQGLQCGTSVAQKHYSISFETGFTPVGMFLRQGSPGHTVVLHDNQMKRIDSAGIPVWESENPFNVPHCTDNTCRLHEMEYQGRPLVMISHPETERFAIFRADSGAALFTDVFGASTDTSLKLVDIKTNGPHALLLHGNPAETKFELNFSSASILNEQHVTYFSCTERPVFGFTTNGKTLFAFPSDLSKPESVKKIQDKNVVVFEPSQFHSIIETGETRLIDAFVVDDQNIWVAVGNNYGTSIWKLGEERPRFSSVGRHEVKFQPRFAPGLGQSIQNLKGLQVALVAEGHIAVHDLIKNQTPLSFYSPGLNAKNPLLTEDGELLVTEIGSGANRILAVYKLSNSEMLTHFALGRGRLLDLMTLRDLMGTGKAPIHSVLVSTSQGTANWFIRPNLDSK